MIQKLAWAFGLVFVVAGLAGFVPALTPGGKLLGLLHVNAIENIIHLAGGAIAVFAAMNSAASARLFFKVFGAVYVLVAIIGFVQGDTVLGLFPTDALLNSFHLIVGVLFMVIGFAVKEGMSHSSMGGTSSNPAM